MQNLTYEKEIWHYQKTNIDHIKRAIISSDWEKTFSNIDIDKMFSIFNQTIINLLCNFIPISLFYLIIEIPLNEQGNQKIDS